MEAWWGGGLGEGEASAVLLQSVPAQARTAFVPAVKLSLVWSPQEKGMSLGQLPSAAAMLREGLGCGSQQSWELGGGSTC